MANQSRNAVITALITYLDTNIAAIKGFEDGPIPVTSATDSDFPLLIVAERGETLIDRFTTASREINLSLDLSLYYNSSDTTEAVARGISDDLVKYCEQAAKTRLPDSDGTETCLNISANNETTVHNVQDSGLHQRIRSVDIVIEQEFA